MAIAGTALAVTATALPACGGSEDARSDADYAHITYRDFHGTGNRRDRTEMLKIYAQMRDAFLEGDAEGVCGAYYRRSDRWRDRCEREVSRAAEAFEAGDVRWPPRRIDWVRSYTPVAPEGGVTMFTRGRGSPIKLEFVKQDGEWRPQMLIPSELPAFTARPERNSYIGFTGDRGPWRDRARMMEVFNDLHDALEAGDAAAICARLSRPPLGGSADRCEGRVADEIEAVRRGDVRWPPHEFLWVRSSGDAGGVTLIESRRRPVRLRFVRQGGDWRADFQAPDGLRVLNAR